MYCNMTNEMLVERIRGGLNNYQEHNFTSIVEHLAEIEEMHKNRLVRNSEKLGIYLSRKQGGKVND